MSKFLKVIITLVIASSFQASMAMSNKRIDFSSQGLTSLEGLVFEEGVLNITVDNNNLTTFDGANFPESLNSISANNNNIAELTNIPEGLGLLAIGGNQLTNVNGLPTSLRILFASDNQINSLEGLNGLVEVSNLGIENNLISDISIIQNMNQLVDFSFDNNNVTNINFTWPNSLERVTFSNNQIEDITPLASITNLQTLFAQEGSINSIPDLSGLTDLRNLILSGHQISELNCSFLPSSLRDIFIFKNNLNQVVSPCDITMSRLKEFSLGSNNLTELNLTIRRARKLRLIDLSSNDLSSLENITVKPRRRSFILDVRDNPNLPRSEVRKFRRRHPNARVRFGSFI